MSKSKTDKHLTLSYKKTISKSDLHPLKGIGNGKIKVLKKLQGFLFFFNKHYTFYTKNLFIQPKNCIQSIQYNERCKEFRKNQFFSNIFTFLSVIRQNFEDNLRNLANFGKFSRKNSKIYGFRPYVFKKLQFSFFVFFNKDYSFLH